MQRLLVPAVLRKARACASVAVAIAAVFLGSLAPVATSTALAVQPALDPTPTPSEAQQKQAELLERLLQREQNVLQREQKRLELAAKAVTTVQQRIDSLKAQGRDTAPLETALASFKAAIAKAQSFHDQAKAILDAHAGFDADGQVIDRAQARRTLRTAGIAERQFHLTARQTTVDLRTAIAIYRLGQRAAAGSLAQLGTAE